MDPELKEKWLKALRSGEYKQGNGRLRNESDCYCCLGVLCDVSGVGKWTKVGEGEYPMYLCGDTNCAGVLWGELEEALSVPSEAIGTLMNMNDKKGNTFEEIATYIEANL